MEATRVGPVHLPEEIMIQILSRVPPKSLVRFMSVCKSWYALIEDPKFVVMHFSNYDHSVKYVLLNRLLNNYTFSLITFPLAVDPSVVVFKTNEDIEEDGEIQAAFEVRGHSHGLVCVGDLYGSTYLINPTTRRFQKLPESSILTESPVEAVTNAIGFGYDSKSCDFKVVRVVSFINPSRIDLNYPSRVEVYSLNKDRWREIETSVCGFVHWAPSFEMHHEGTYYWWAATEDAAETEIIQTFDMREEVFSQISVPESFEWEDENYRSLGVLDGSVVLLHYPKSGDEKMFDVWKMENDDGVSWVKLFTIGPVSGIKKPLVFVSSDELFMEANEGKLVLYNMKTQQLQDVPLIGDPARAICATLIVKSMFPVLGEGNNIEASRLCFL